MLAGNLGPVLFSFVFVSSGIHLHCISIPNHMESPFPSLSLFSEFFISFRNFYPANRTAVVKRHKLVHNGGCPKFEVH